MAEQLQHELPTQSSVPTLPQIADAVGDTSFGSAITSATESKVLAEAAERVKERAIAVQSQASELQQLELRLQAAEQKKQELEAKELQV